MSDDVLVGARILLRAPLLADAAGLFASVTSDPNVTEFLRWTPHADIGETRRAIRELLNVGDDHTWVVVLRDTGEVIGELGYRRPQLRAADMGYCMAVRWWGRGLMSEALGVALGQLQKDPQLLRVTAAVHVDNARSARLLQRCGFELEGRAIRHTVFPNLGPNPRDCLLYARAMR